jgi:hypothetical protein
VSNQDVENDEHDLEPATTPRTSSSTPSSSPPPSFRSRTSSPTTTRLLSADDPLGDDEDQTLADAFGDGESSDEEDGIDNRQKMMRADTGPVVQDDQPTTTATTSDHSQITSLSRRVPELPVVTPTSTRQQPRGGTDGVFANLDAKPERAGAGDEKPPVSLPTLPAVLVTRR